jgi:hypothetical protein
MGDSLMVKHAELLDYGNKLVNTGNELNQDLSELNDNMSVVPEAWPDQNGVELASLFSDFIAKAKPINEELIKLGNYAKTSATDYVNIESTRSGAMV